MAYEEPEYLPWDGRRVPITFVGGYLGAGKTTAINEVLANADRPIAIVVNAFRVALTGFLAHYFGEEAAGGPVHDFQGIITFGFPAVLPMKAWFTTGAMVLGLVQVATALRIGDVGFVLGVGLAALRNTVVRASLFTVRARGNLAANKGFLDQL